MPSASARRSRSRRPETPDRRPSEPRPQTPTNNAQESAHSSNEFVSFGNARVNTRSDFDTVAPELAHLSNKIQIFFCKIAKNSRFVCKSANKPRACAQKLTSTLQKQLRNSSFDPGICGLHRACAQGFTKYGWMLSDPGLGPKFPHSSNETSMFEFCISTFP